jgi:hypothetical protein
MEFGDALTLLAGKVSKQWNQVETEEATKNAFIMPFIATVLGYDVFNPQEVIPEFTADVGVKKGEKVDYAIRTGGDIQILIECKKASVPLSLENASQLYRYFSVTAARIAILTNGRIYNFYTDLDSPNRMDSKPFLVLDLLDVDETVLPELRKLAKDNFDVDSVVSSAEELKYVGAMKREVSAEFREPSYDFIKLLTSRVYEGRFSQSTQEKFTPLVAKALSQFLTEKVNDRLKSALGVSDISAPTIEATVEEPESAQSDIEEPGDEKEKGIETTEEELFAYSIIKAIACADIDPSRITYRDAKSYCAILLDNNNRKPIARLFFNSREKKWVGIFDDNKDLVRHDIDSLQAIYSLSDDIRHAVQRMIG